MDWTIVLTGVGTVITIVGVNITLFSWLRSDIGDIKSEISADRRDILSLMRGIQKDTQEFKQMMAAEIKDFHGRLCAIEERNKH